MRYLLLVYLAFVTACGGSGGGNSGGAGAGGGGSPSPPAPEPPAVSASLAPAFPGLGFEAPMAMVQPPGDLSTWFLIERRGRVWRFDAADTVSSASLVIDISAQVSGSGEGGLLGIALHPGFASNGRAFLSYTAPLAPLESRVSEFISLDGGLTLDADSERIVLTVLQDAGNHNGGNIAFGPDGMLYFGLGDGGGSNDPLDRAQDTTNLLGAMVRIDVDEGQPYGIPADNPFAGNATCVQGFGSAPCPEIYAWGLRNPWRFSFDRDSGDLWLGDVGQDGWEEVDVVRVGENYGWPIREGANCNPNLFSDGCDTTGLVDPVAEYDHSLGRSITGGYVYRGGAVANLAGSYVFGDFATGRIWRLVDDSGNLALEELIDTELRIVSFAEAADGELFVLGLEGGIFRLVDSATAP
ncbi:MAG: PQQ-dependent sugar dehydrogenase [Halieaceae bacterium]|jgi:glucose/arabinose dehydrogenase|nr:PQQ-dependent sugar dehydrogenase [Halieaceae bacterium]